MFIFLMVLEGLIALALVCVILLQKSDGSGLSGLSGAGSPAGFMSARGAANFLTRATGFLAVAFMGICLLLAAISSRENEDSSVLNEISTSQENKPPTPIKTTNPVVPAT